MNTIEPLNPDIVPDPLPLRPEPTPLSQLSPDLPLKKVEEPVYVSEKNYAGIVLIWVGLFNVVMGLYMWLSNLGDESGLAAFIAVLLIGFGLFIAAIGVVAKGISKRIVRPKELTPEAKMARRRLLFIKSLIYFSVAVVLMVIRYVGQFAINEVPALFGPYLLFVPIGTIAALAFSVAAIANFVRALKIKATS